MSHDLKSNTLDGMKDMLNGLILIKVKTEYQDHIHKQHHEFKANVGIAAEYFHPVEDLFNIIPMITGPLLLKMHFCTFMVWIVIRISEIVDAHSGYALPFSIWEISLRLQGGADRHEFHHSHNKGSYGSFTKFWDWMFNTDAAYYEWKAKKSAKKTK